VPILVTDLGIVTEVSAVQLWNAFWSIEITEFGIGVEVSLKQLENAYRSILFTEDGLIYVTEVRFEQLANASLAILVTDVGIVTEVSAVQTWNARISKPTTSHIIPFKSVILLGIVIIPLELDAKICSLVTDVIFADNILAV